MLCLKIKISQRKSLCAITVPARKGLIVSLTKDSALLWDRSANNVRSKITSKIPRNANDYTKKDRRNQQIKNNQDRQRSPLS